MTTNYTHPLVFTCTQSSSRLIRHIGFVSSATVQDTWFWSVFCMSLSCLLSLICICMRVLLQCVCGYLKVCDVILFFFPVYSTKINSVKAFTMHSRKPAQKKPSLHSSITHPKKHQQLRRRQWQCVRKTIHRPAGFNREKTYNTQTRMHPLRCTCLAHSLKFQVIPQILSRDGAGACAYVCVCVCVRVHVDLTGWHKMKNFVCFHHFLLNP